MGVLMYILLCGWPPFNGVNEQEIFKNIAIGTPDFSYDPWPKVSDPAKEILHRMLERDASKRATAEEVLMHPWVREGGVAGDLPIEPEVFVRLRGFAAMNKLKKEALRVRVF